MFGRKRAELLLNARIKELENIICPAEQHDYHVVDRIEHVMFTGGIPDIEYTEILVCKKCQKESL